MFKVIIAPAGFARLAGHIFWNLYKRCTRLSTNDVVHRVYRISLLMVGQRVL